jgi:hypothetical protein
MRYISKLKKMAQHKSDAQHEYKYHEPEILTDLEQYIEKTYSSHYGKSKYQAMEVIIDQGRGEEFCLGCIQKYISRYGMKDDNKKLDLMKMIHYAIIAIHAIDSKNA